MDAQTVIWTLILFGGTVLAVVILGAIAWRKDREDAHRDDTGTEK